MTPYDRQYAYHANELARLTQLISNYSQARGHTNRNNRRVASRFDQPKYPDALDPVQFSGVPRDTSSEPEIPAWNSPQFDPAQLREGGAYRYQPSGRILSKSPEEAATERFWAMREPITPGRFTGATPYNYQPSGAIYSKPQFEWGMDDNYDPFAGLDASVDYATPAPQPQQQYDDQPLQEGEE